eukprot:scaffold426_cov219-Amphora_coffeaeformis.AAC.51
MPMLSFSPVALLALVTSLFRTGEGLSTLSPDKAATSRSTSFGGGEFLFGLPSFASLPSFESFRSGSVPLVCIPNALNAAQILAWKQDAQALRSLAFGATAGVATGHRGIRSGVHQVWLQSPGCPTSQNFLVGNIDARKDLVRFVDTLRVLLQQTSNDGGLRLPPELVELSYLLYDNDGAAYAKHVDSFANDAGSDRTRRISFLLYLGDEQEELAWDCARDGGALRIHDEAFAKATGQPVYTNVLGEYWSDITPHPGTMVLFDSSSVPHEVVATKRGRICVVGWLGTHRGTGDSAASAKLPIDEDFPKP